MSIGFRSLTEAEPDMNVHGYVPMACYSKDKTGNLNNVWSSFTKKGYAVGQVIIRIWKILKVLGNT